MQQCVINEMKVFLKPYYTRRRITKEQYKEIMRSSVTRVIFKTSIKFNRALSHFFAADDLDVLTFFRGLHQKNASTRLSSDEGL